MDDKTLHALTLLADKLGVAVEFIWSALIKQAYISGVFDLCLSILLVFGLVWITRFLWKVKNDGLYDSNAEIAKVVVFILWGLCLVIIPMSIYGAITAFANPEYWALKQVWR